MSHGVGRAPRGTRGRARAISSPRLHVELVGAVPHALRVAHDRLRLQAEQHLVGLGVLACAGSARRWSPPAAGRCCVATSSMPRLAVRCSGMPWSWISRKKLSLPEDVGVLARPRAAPASTSSVRAARSATSPFRQAESADQPLAVLARGAPCRCAACSRSPRGGRRRSGGPGCGSPSSVSASSTRWLECDRLALARLRSQRAAGGDVDLAADDRLDALGLGRLVEVDRRRTSRRGR